MPGSTPNQTAMLQKEGFLSVGEMHRFIWNIRKNSTQNQKEETTQEIATTTETKETDFSPLVRVTVTNLNRGSLLLPFSDRVIGPYAFAVHVTAHDVTDNHQYEPYQHPHDELPTLPCLKVANTSKSMNTSRSSDHHVIGVANLFPKRSVTIDLFDHESDADGHVEHQTPQNLETYRLAVTVTSNMRLKQDNIPFRIELNADNSQNISIEFMSHEKYKETRKIPEHARHLILLAHGLNGTRNDLHYMQEQLECHIKKHDIAAHVVVPTINHCLTLEGIEPNGQRLAKQILELVDQMSFSDEELSLSLIGYSMGGLLIRYASGWLVEHYPEKWNKWRKINFVTFASPHVSAREDFWHIRLGASVIGRTGKELMLRDHPTEPLLVRMTLKDSPYMRALDSFEHRRVFSNITGDPLVGYCTAAIRAHNPYENKLNDFKDDVEIIEENEEHLLEASEQDLQGNRSAYYSWMAGFADSFIATMLKNLNQLSWHRTAVFLRVKTENTHRAIVVRRELLNSVARPVVSYFVNKFVFE